MFHLFRTRTGSKRVYIVRHGESAYNEAMARSSSWADPLIFDARLTEKGRQQVGTRGERPWNGRLGGQLDWMQWGDFDSCWVPVVVYILPG